MDVIDDGLPADRRLRGKGVAEVFGLTDRYTWLREDFPRDDGAPRRPLPFRTPSSRLITAARCGSPAGARHVGTVIT